MTITQKKAFFTVLALAIFSTLYNIFLPLHGDEAYYWMWSHQLQGGYYDHPPLIAFMIYITNFISEAEWGVRLVNVFSMSMSAYVIYKLTCKVSNEESALKAIYIFSSVVIIHAGYTITTPDSPLILFWSLSLYSAYCALFENSTKHFILVGLFLGLMMLSKYTAILFVLFLLLFLLLKRRDVFLDYRFYVAIFIAMLVVSPLLYWNYQHEWISFLFQINHGTNADKQINLNSFFEFFGAQFGIFSPIFLGLFFYLLYKHKLFFKDDKLFFLSLSALVVLLFFQYKALFAFLEVNYDAPAFIGITIVLAVLIEKEQWNKSFKAGIYFALFISVLARFGLLFYLEVVQDRMYGNREAIALLNTHAQKDDKFYGSHLTFAALLKYYLPNHPDTQVLTPSRYSHYDMVQKEGWMSDGLFLSIENKSKQLHKLCSGVKLVDTLKVKRGIDREKIFYIYRVSGCKE